MLEVDYCPDLQKGWLNDCERKVKCSAWKGTVWVKQILVDNLVE